MKRSILCVLLGISVFPASVVRSSESNARKAPRLVVFVSVDQLKGNVFDRFGALFHGGFARLLHEGAHAANADLNYAPTETGPGHATMSTGTYPRKSGIVSNQWRDASLHRDVYCVEDTAAKAFGTGGGGVSPRNLRTTAVGDWLKAVSPTSKVIALSIKDRAAILMGGKQPDLAAWYNTATGAFVSNDYYRAALPDWLRAFNALRWPETRMPDAWTKLLPDSVYNSYGPDELIGENLWDTTSAFPHPFSPAKRRRQIIPSPYGNEMLLALAREAVIAEQLGLRPVTDLLCVSLSSTDYLGQAFGPDSHEMIDNLVRLDAQLDAFLSFLETRVGREHLLVVLTADHAAMSLPEYLQSVMNVPARRLRADRELIPRITTLDSSLMRECKSEEHILLENGHLNYAAAARAGVDADALQRLVRERALRTSGIAEVIFRSELLSRTPLSQAGEYFRRSSLPEQGQDFVIVYQPHTLVTNEATGTSHGSPYRYDTHIPILFWGPEFPTHRLDRRVHLVDVAPTIAALIGIMPPASVDGTAIKEILP